MKTLLALLMTIFCGTAFAYEVPVSMPKFLNEAKRFESPSASCNFTVGLRELRLSSSEGSIRVPVPAEASVTVNVITERPFEYWRRYEIAGVGSVEFYQYRDETGTETTITLSNGQTWIRCERTIRN